MYQAVLFDLDGTFADTALDLALAVNQMREECGLAPLPIGLTRPHTSSGARGLIHVAFGLGPEDDAYPALRERFLDLYGENVCVNTRPFEGIPELLNALEARRIPWGIVTNKASRFTDPLMRELGLHARAACIVSGDTTGKIKPAPDSLLYAAKALNLRPSACLYVGDDLRDVQAARAAGTGVLAVAYGYLGAEGDPHAWRADAVIDHPSEVLNFLG